MMEEVDSIILHFLKQLEINIGDDVKHLSDLESSTIIKSVSKCLCTINPSLKLADNLPEGISQRIEVASQIASACKDLGYKNDVGYQTFLYHNETELRPVFMFLIENLPNDGVQGSQIDYVESKKSKLLLSIGQKIDEEMKTIWIPSSCFSVKSNTIGDFDTIKDKSNIILNTLLGKESELITQIMSIARKDSELQPKQEETKVKNEKSITVSDKNLKELKEETIHMRNKINDLESEKNVMDMELKKANNMNEKAQTELKSLLDILASVGVDVNDNDSVLNILDKVQQNIQELHLKSENLTSRSLELKLKIDNSNAANNNSEPERSKHRRILVSLRDTAKSLKEEYTSKEQLKQQLQIKNQKLRTGNKRSTYTKRILEIIANINKQNFEIKKVLDDTRQLQKEINSLEGQLDRCFSIADETLFEDARKDDQAKKAYKLLALLHSECTTIVSLINDAGVLARDIIDLEDNINAVKTKGTEETIRKIEHDLTKMQRENIAV